jgi:choline dehydrogenase-like flavoprotein
MFIDLAKERPGGPLKADVAVVGSGPAGLTIARRLQSLGRDVLLLESGTFGYKKTVQALNDGDDALGRTNHLRTSRIRAFGGTSFYWGGWCAPLDPVDFAERAWIKHSGWPISKADLTSYYAAASEICELDKLGFEVEQWAELRKQQPLSLNGDEFSTTYFQLSPPTNFGRKYRREVEASRKITAVLNATVTAVRLESNGASCKGLSVAGPDGKTIEVQARQYVLACGGIENVRLLLSSNDVQANGIGNANDLVGRFFMDHPAFFSGAMTPADPKLDIGYYVYDSVSKIRGFGTITPTPALMQKVGSINFNIELRPHFEGMGNSRNALKDNYWELFDKLKRREILDDFERNLSTFFSMVGNGAFYAWASLLNQERKVLYADLRHHVECSPNPDSRVTVNRQKKDRLGQPVAQLDWRINAADIDGWLRAQEAVALAFEKAGIGRMRIDTSLQSE